ncbi:MAG: DUF262 domain-containing HNH endonuclease family protein [Candidatus Brocadia sp.]|nr:DUF262 domain-containing HNH endonuclease family protein [Candidatus Brocadia sp.]
MSNIIFENKGIGKLIKDRQLAVPIYQRPYAWEDKNISDLFSDIHNAISSNENEYFLGTIVLSEKENSSELEIVDGQQRITSIVIFLSSVRDYFENNKQQRQAASIQNDFISGYDRQRDENLPKLKLGQLDNTFFRKYIVDKEIKEKQTKDSHRRIATTKKLATEQIEKLVKASNQDLNLLHEWIKFIEEKLKVVSIIVPSKANAFTIFETLNDRGIELAQVDLLKNYLYSKAAGDRLEEIQNLWIEMTSKIESAENESLILTYIRHHWSSQYGLTREKNRELYNGIKSNIRNSSQAVSFVDNLNKDTGLYLAIINHNHQYWNDFDQTVKQHVETLNFFKLEQFRPLLLAILKKFKEKKEVKKALKLIVSWLVRNLITGSLGGGTLEKEYANKAKKVFNEEIKNAKELKEDLKKLIPDDAEFKEKFITATVSTEKYARYYLRAIENQKKDTTSPELIVNSDPDVVNLEHILPKNPHKNWSNFNEDQVVSLNKRIGNLTLMQNKLNSEQGNEPFSKKKIYFMSSDLWITKMIADNYGDWTPDNIRDRQEKLANIAVQTWNLNFDSQ